MQLNLKKIIICIEFIINIEVFLCIFCFALSLRAWWSVLMLASAYVTAKFIVMHSLYVAHFSTSLHLFPSYYPPHIFLLVPI
jgi:hypothetical protein